MLRILAFRTRLKNSEVDLHGGVIELGEPGVSENAPIYTVCTPYVC